MNFSTFAISDIRLTAISNESLKDLYSFGSPLNLLISNFSNFKLVVLLTGLFISVALVVSSVFISLIFVVTLSLFLYSRLLFHSESPPQFLFYGLLLPHSLFPLEFLHLTLKLSALFSLSAIFFDNRVALFSALSVSRNHWLTLEINFSKWTLCLLK